MSLVRISLLALVYLASGSAIADGVRVTAKPPSWSPPGESQPLVRRIAMRAVGEDNEQREPDPEGEEAAKDEKESDDSGIPGAVVAVIFGVFGLLVIARRNLR